MNAQTEFDTGPLSWVKNEIDLALERAANALNVYAESAAADNADLSHIQYCRTHLHQVQGALTIVGLDGVRQLAEALESLLESVENGTTVASKATITLIHQGLQGIGNYLDTLLTGHGNQPLRLFPLYAAIQQACGNGQPSPIDLFFPDLSVRPPRRAAPAETMPEATFQEHLRHERGRFQRGLLAWLRDPQQQDGINDMLEAVRSIEATQDAAPARAFWWVASALLTALSEGALPEETDVKQVCARIDLQIRRMIEGSKNVAERLMRDLLYLVAVCQSTHPAIEEIRHAYRLREALRADEAPIASVTHESILHRLHETIAAAEDAWNKFCAGTPQALPLFRECALAIAAFADQLERTDYRRLTQAIVATANNLNDDVSRHSEALAMEVATALLLAQNAQENFTNLGNDFAHQVDITVARIHGCLAGAPPKTDAEIPLLDEMSRKAQERLLVVQVAREIQVNLGQIEQTLDTFFRNAETRGDLAQLAPLFRQTEGALTLIGHDGAAKALRACQQETERFEQPDYTPQDNDFQRIANELSLLGFYVDAIPSGTSDFTAFIAQMQKKPADAQHGKVFEENYDEQELDHLTVEQEVVQQKREAKHLLGALLEQPDDAELREELRQNLTALKSDADLVADAALSQQADAALIALDEGKTAAPQIQEAIASLKTPGEATPQPSESTLQLSQASTEEIDAELLEIFIEEAREVLASVGENTQRIRQHPHDIEALTTIRRAFHTLKGSGRMVGLKDLGETAWEIEQTLNLWLRQEHEVTFALVSLLEQAKLRLDEWVEHLASHSGITPDVTSLIEFAGTLRRPEGSPTASRSETSVNTAGTPASLSTTAITSFIDQHRAEVEAANQAAADTIATDTAASDELTIPEASTSTAETVMPVAADKSTASAISLTDADATRSAASEVQNKTEIDDNAVDALEPFEETIEISTPDGEDFDDFVLVDETTSTKETSVTTVAQTVPSTPEIPTIRRSPAMPATSVFGLSATPSAPAGDAAPTPRIAPVSYDENIARALARARSAESEKSAAPITPTPEPHATATAAPVMQSSAQSANPPKIEPISYADILALASATKTAPEKPTAPAMSAHTPTPATTPSTHIADTPTAPVAPHPVPAVQTPKIPDALLSIFREESSTYLATLYRELPRIERANAPATPHEMYRAAHTLAGIAATVGVDALNQISHALEKALLRRDDSPVRNHLGAPSIIRQAIQAIDGMLNALFHRRDIRPDTALTEALDALYPIDSSLPASIGPDSNAPASPANDISPTLANAHASAVETAGIEALEIPLAASTSMPPVADGVALITPVAPSPSTEPAGLEAPILSAAIAALPRRQDEIDEQLLPIFLEEAQELTQRISEQLRIWYEAPEDGQPAQLLARLLHTLKGSARMAGAMNLGEITHAIETRVQEASRTLPAARKVIGEIESVFDDVQQIIERLQRGETLEASPAAPAREPASTAQDGAPVAPITATVPTTSAATKRPETPKPPSSISPAPDRRAAPRPAEHESRQATLRVRADLFDRLVNEAGELSIARTRIEGEMRSLKESLLDLTESVIRLRRQLRDIEIQAETQMQSRNVLAESQHAGFDPLEFDRFTQFQEITRMMAESVNDVTTVQQNLLRNLDEANAALLAQSRVNRTLQQELMSVRMVQAGSLSDRLYRIVRQTSKELGKRVSLEITGSQVEIDRSVLEKIAAPLEHMLRNAISHGIEKREVRQNAGKAEMGEVSLSFRQEGNEVIVSLTDDGAGLNLQRIRERAIESNLIARGEHIDDGQLAQLILLPGFSTATQISQISGRGVGMDVVKSEITSLGGRVEIASHSGKGTQITLYIPLTLAVTKALLVRVGKRSYAIPSAMIEQVLDLKDEALNQAHQAGKAEWQGESYPLMFLAHLLGDTKALPEERRQHWVLLLHSGTRRIAVQVDELQGNHEIVVKNIGAQLARVVGINGATVLGDGKVVLIINPVALSARAPLIRSVSADMSGAAIAQPTETSAHTPTVMVVDDSLTVRKITGRLLAREGYHVLTAKDGVDALEQLVETEPDVMLVDIEMPRMDGFDLTRHIRADKRLHHIPIIMITSRTAEKHRNYAFEIGVNHFLGKPYQEEELLALIAQRIRQQRGSTVAH